MLVYPKARAYPSKGRRIDVILIGVLRRFLQALRAELSLYLRLLRVYEGVLNGN